MKKVKPLKFFTHTTFFALRAAKKYQRRGDWERADAFWKKLITMHRKSRLLNAQYDKFREESALAFLNLFKNHVPDFQGVTEKNQQNRMMYDYNRMFEAVEILGRYHPDICTTLEQVQDYFPEFLTYRLTRESLREYGQSLVGKDLCFGRYKVNTHIHTGEKSVVFQCRETSSHEKCIVKFVESMLEEPREIRIQNRLAHTGIVPGIHSQECYGTDFFIVMDHIDGHTLLEYIYSLGSNSGHMEKEKEMVTLALKICSAIEIIHENGICHLDIKPENILITYELGKKSVVIIDFDNAEFSLKGTKGMDFRGSPPYTAPELPQFSVQSDVYALGVILWNVLLGHPVNKLGPVITKNLIANSTAFERVAIKAFHKDLKCRFTDMKALRCALEQCLESMSRHQYRNNLVKKDLCGSTLVLIQAGKVKYQQKKFSLDDFFIDKTPISVGQFENFREKSGLYDVKGCGVNPYALEMIWTREGFQWVKNFTPSRMADHIKISIWHDPVKICWYEAVAFCNWRTIMANDPSILQQHDFKIACPVLQEILSYNDAGLIQGKSSFGFRLPTELELAKAVQTDNFVPASRKTGDNIYEFTTSSNFEISDLKKMTKKFHPIPYNERLSPLITEVINEYRSSLIEKAKPPSIKTVFRCVYRRVD